MSGRILVTSTVLWEQGVADCLDRIRENDVRYLGWIELRVDIVDQCSGRLALLAGAGIRSEGEQAQRSKKNPAVVHKMRSGPFFPALL